MLNIEICHCKKVTLADIERVLFESKTMSDVEGAFESVQQQTKCSTGTVPIWSLSWVRPQDMLQPT